MTFEAE